MLTFTQYGYLRTHSAGDTDNSNGIVWDMALLYRYTNGGLTVTPVLVCSGTAKTRTNTIMAYRAKSPLAAVCVAITRTTAGPPELSASYNFLGDWSVYGTATRLSG